MRRRALRVLFVVQGEGRGHMTQALALGEMLRARGHEVVRCVAGASRRRDVPAFFRRRVGCPVETVESPSFVASASGAIRPVATLLRTLRRARRYGPSLDRLEAVLDAAEPDVVVNFYEGLMGAFGLLRVSDVPVVAVGHQFMARLPGYPHLPRQPMQRTAMEAYTRLVGAGAAVRLALSFYDAPDAPEHGIRVVPPLLRRSLFALADRPSDGSILVYLMEPALLSPLADWSARRPDVRLHVFTDAAPHDVSPALTVHGLSGTAFLERMAVARGVVCTAGFESVSEAMWLGKPALMVPVPNHYEQRCNAVDAASVGAGIAASVLDLDPLLERLDAGPEADPTGLAAPTSRFRAWVAQAEGRVVGAIEEAAGLPPLLPGDGGDGLGAEAVRLDVGRLQ
ncbi:MAG: glycosyltransferase family protein [Bacteroidota bacterium]